jgi:hypothetical protein
MNKAAETLDSKVLTEVAERLAEAMKHAKLAYQFTPGSYTCTTLQACLAAAKAFDQHVDELAFAHSAEWLRRFPKISEGSDAE